jgi:2-dehydro-3-deoxygalactonokinase
MELPYATLPFKLDGSNVIWKDLGVFHTNKSAHRVILVSGLRGEEEIMRGEETQLLGLTGLDAGRLMQEEAIIVLPGTHSKHVHIKGARVVDFETYMTGELFEVLSQHSVLRHSLPSGDCSKAPGLADPMPRAFQEGVEAARTAPLLRQLFRVRTRRVLHGGAPEENRAFLSGLLIGAEVAGLIHHCAREVPVVLCAGESLSEPYEIAWHILGPKDGLHVISSAEVERLSVLGQAVLLQRIRAAEIRASVADA